MAKYAILTLKQVLEQKLDHLDLCDVNRLTFDDFRISGKNPESSLKIDSKSFGQKSIHRTRAIISRSWLEAALEYKPYIRTEFSEKTYLKTKKLSLEMG